MNRHRIDGWLAILEQPLLFWLTDQDENRIIKLFNRYIDFTGNYQYWGFFAPDAPLTHRYLRVCEKIMDIQRDRIECLGLPLYKSYAGSLEDAIRSYNGDRSRSFHLTVNLVGLDHIDIFQQFTNYWIVRDQSKQQASFHQGFLILSEYSLHPRERDKTRQHQRKDKILWGWGKLSPSIPRP